MNPQPSYWSAFKLRRNIASIFVRNRASLTILDGLRAIAILLVLSYHSFVGVEFVTDLPTLGRLIAESPWWVRWVWEGTHGADLSLLLSGFLIGYILFKELDKTQNIALGQFYLRRWVRLSPAYFACLLLLGCLVSWRALWYYPLFISNFFEPGGQVMAWAWSLAVETQFYIIFPFFILFFLKRSNNPLRLLFGVWALSLLIRWGVLASEDYFRAYQLQAGPLTELGKRGALHEFDVLYDNLYTRFGSLFSGVLASYIYLKHTRNLEDFFKNKTIFAHVLFVFAMAWVAFSSYQKGYNPYWNYSDFLPGLYLVCQHHLFTGAVAYIILFCLYPQGVARWISVLLSSRIWFPISQLSYSIYLYHLIVLSMVLPAFKPAILNALDNIGLVSLQLFGVFAVTLLCSLMVAFLSYVLIEKPAIELRILWEARRDSRVAKRSFAVS